MDGIFGAHDDHRDATKHQVTTRITSFGTVQDRPIA